MHGNRVRVKISTRLATQWLFAGTIICGSLLGFAVRGSTSMIWVYILCLLSASVVAAAQQTLP